MENTANTFIVKIMKTENSSWQGSVTWADKNETQYFRSGLELMHFMQEIVENKKEDEEK